MGRILSVLTMFVLVAGCSTSASVEDRTAEVDRLEAEVEVLETQLEAAEEVIRTQQEEFEEARRIANISASVADDEACLDKLSRCEEMLFPPDEDEEWPPPSPALWFPPTPSYITESDTIEVVVFAPESSQVSIAGSVVESGGRWVGGNAVFVHDVPLAEGRNPIEIVADGEPIPATVERNSSLTRQYGRVLDSRAVWSESRTDHFIGIDYGDMDLEPDYGQGDFEAGEVIVEFVQLTPISVAVVTSPYSSKIVLTGEDDIWEYFSYEVSHFDPWSILLDKDTLIQIEGPIPLGD